MSDEQPEEQVIPARRLPPKDHLRRASVAVIGSDAERYHLAAAAAEALFHIEERLGEMIVVLARIATRLDRLDRGPQP